MKGLDPIIIALLGFAASISALNSTILNPILPGFSPDPSCVFVEELNNTTFCVTSSFIAFPGLPVTASRDLQTWSLISHAFSHKDQVPEFEAPNLDTGGLWAPTLRYHDGIFYVVSTVVLAGLPENDPSRWISFIVSTTDPFCSACWSGATYFEANGYDPSLFWDDDGQVYVTWSSLWTVKSGIFQSTIDLATGNVGEPINIWNGTGGTAPEGPRTYKKDGYYHLMIAEGGTFLDHMVTIARSRSIDGPYESNPANPILTNANTTEYFQAAGHADLFQDMLGNWWGVAHALRVNLQDQAFPMGRESVLFPVTWADDAWPTASPVRGSMLAWQLPGPSDVLGEVWDSSDHFNPILDSTLPSRFVGWGLLSVLPDPKLQSKDGLCLDSSISNLLTLTPDGLSAGNSTFLGQRQSHTLFTFSVSLDFKPRMVGHEAGVTVFVSEKSLIQLGHILLPARNGTPNGTQNDIQYLRIATTSGNQTQDIALTELPNMWQNQPVTLQIMASNSTHYTFSAGPASHQSQMQVIGHVGAALLQPIFTGALVGVYTTTNGEPVRHEACFQSWQYHGVDQFRT